MLEDFHLKELYHCHDDLEVSELLDLALKNNGQYIENLFKNVLQDFAPKSKEEIYRMLFGAEMLSENQDKRPLSKLKHDLLEEIGQVYGVNIVEKMNNLKLWLGKIWKKILTVSIKEWMLGLALALYIVWYHQIENLLQHTLIDHIVSYLPDACWQSDITICIIMVVELFFIIKINRERISYSRTEVILSLLIIGSCIYSKCHQYLTFYHFSFCQYLDYCLAILIVPVVDLVYWVQNKIKAKDDRHIQGAFLEDCATVEDSFGRSHFAKVLVNEIIMLDNKQSAYTIGLNAKYGMGKTSFMIQMQNLLEQHKTSYVCISPWSCTSNGQIVKDFFHSISGVIGRKMGLGINKLLSIYKDLILDVQHAYKIKAFDDLLKNEKSIYEVYEEIKEKLSICKEKIIVFIDDVDRLQASELAMIIQLIRNTGNFPYVVFMLFYDKDYMVKALEQNKSITDADEYLKKIINVELMFPAYDAELYRSTITSSIDSILRLIISDAHERETIVTSFIERMLPKSEILSIDYLEYAFPNYRDLKRFISMFSLDLKMLLSANQDKVECWENEIDVADFILIELLKYVRPDLYEMLRSRKDTLLEPSKDEYTLRKEVKDFIRKEENELMEKLFNRIASLRNEEKDDKEEKQPKIKVDLKENDKQLIQQRNYVAHHLLDVLFLEERRGDKERMLRNSISYTSYFLYSLSKEQISLPEFNSIFHSQDNIKDFFVNEKNKLKFESYFKKLRTYMEEDESNTDIIGLFNKVFLSARLYAESKCNEPNHSIHNVFTYLNQIIKYDLEPLRYLYFTTIRSEYSVISKEAFVSLLQNGNFLWEKMILVNGMGELRNSQYYLFREDGDLFLNILNETIKRTFPSMVNPKDWAFCHALKMMRELNDEFGDYLSDYLDTEEKQLEWLLLGIYWGKDERYEQYCFEPYLFYNDLVFGIPEDRSYQGNAIIDKILGKTNSDDVKTCISIIKGEIPLDKRNVDNYPVLKKARFYGEK